MPSLPDPLSVRASPRLSVVSFLRCCTWAPDFEYSHGGVGRMFELARLSGPLMCPSAQTTDNRNRQPAREDALERVPQRDEVLKTVLVPAAVEWVRDVDAHRSYG